ncbi:MAG: hypothetical protein COA82_11795 [Alkaliphilus sp.]|nr:MAG: hypothetical protein COA82_11795 [Alkaliphilus sp.]
MMNSIFMFALGIDKNVSDSLIEKSYKIYSEYLVVFVLLTVLGFDLTSFLFFGMHVVYRDIRLALLGERICIAVWGKSRDGNTFVYSSAYLVSMLGPYMSDFLHEYIQHSYIIRWPIFVGGMLILFLIYDFLIEHLYRYQKKKRSI